MKHLLSMIGGAMLGLVFTQGGPALAVDTTTSIVCTDPTLPFTARLEAAKQGYPDPGHCWAYPMADPDAYKPLAASGASRDGPERGDRTDGNLLRHAREDVRTLSRVICWWRLFVQGPRWTFAGFCVAVICVPDKVFALESWPGQNPAIAVFMPSSQVPK